MEDADDADYANFAKRMRQAALDVVDAVKTNNYDCLLYTSDAADERSSVDLGGRRIIKKKKHGEHKQSGEYTTR